MIDRHDLRRYLSDHPGHPLGPGAPMGRSLRLESVFHKPTQTWRGESHRMAWERILRNDPCAYCGAPSVWNPDQETRSGTIDHIEPQDPLRPIRGIGGKYDWTNLVGCCERCNGRKGNKSLLQHLSLRANVLPQKLDRKAA